MTVEQLQKAQELILDMKEKLNKQHEIIMEMMTILNDYAEWQLEEVKRIRNGE
jgi:hypothetical protein